MILRKGIPEWMPSTIQPYFNAYKTPSERKGKGSWVKAFWLQPPCPDSIDFHGSWDGLEITPGEIWPSVTLTFSSLKVEICPSWEEISHRGSCSNDRRLSYQRKVFLINDIEMLPMCHNNCGELRGEYIAIQWDNFFYFTFPRLKTYDLNVNRYELF